MARARPGGGTAEARPDQARLPHRARRLPGHPAPHAAGVHGAPVPVGVAGHLRRHLRGQPGRRSRVQGADKRPDSQSARHQPGGGGHGGHLPDGVGTGPLGCLRLHRVGERGERWVTCLAHHRRLEPGRHGRRSIRSRSGLVPFGADAVTDHGIDRDGRLRAPLRHPDGRGHHGAEGGGAGHPAPERGSVPVTDSELLRRHDDPQRNR